MTKKTILTAEMRSKMAGLLPMDASARYSFTPKEYDILPEDFRPNFTIRQFDNGEIKEIKKILSETVKNIELAKHKKHKKTVEASNERSDIRHKELAMAILLEWENLFDVSTGNVIKYSEDAKLLFTPNMIAVIMQEGIKISGFIPAI